MGGEARKRPAAIRTGKEKAGHDDGIWGGGVGGGSTEEEAAGGEGQPLTPVSRLFHQPNFNCIIISMMGSGEPIDVDAVKAGFEATIVRHPRFSSVLVSDEPGSSNVRWVQTKVVIDNHIVVPDLNPPQNGAAATTTSPEKLIEDYISSLTTKPLPLSATQPLWEFHVINLPTAEAKATAVLRIHHSLGDGVSLMSLLLACARKTSDPDSVPSLPGSGQRKAGDSTAGRITPCGLVVWLWAVLVLAWNSLVDVAIFLATTAFLRDTETTLKGVEGVEFHPKRVVHRTLSLDDIKAVKHAVGGTVNDVLVGVTSAALSCYLNRRYGETANGEKKGNNLPANLRLRSTCLVNVRPTPGIHALAEMMEGGKETRWGNSIGYIILQFPIVMHEDPLDYVRKGTKIAERKNSLEAIFTYASGCLIVKLFGIKTAASLCYRMLQHTTLSFSNIAGPIEEIGFYGHPIVYLAPTTVGHPQAVTLHFQSYMNKMKVVVAVYELSVPDPHRLIDDVAESLELIRDAAVARSSQVKTLA